MKHETLNGLSKSYCTTTFNVDGRIIENNYRCGNTALPVSQLEKIQNRQGKTRRRNEPISIY